MKMAIPLLATPLLIVNTIFTPTLSLNYNFRFFKLIMVEWPRFSAL